METPPPEPLALLAVDQVYHDDDSGRLSLLGLRSAIGAPSFPWQHSHLAAYVALVNGRGETAIQVRIIDSDEERAPVAQSEATIVFPDPLAVIEIVFDMHDLTFPEAGEYRLQLRSDGRFLRERVLVVFQVDD